MNFIVHVIISVFFSLLLHSSVHGGIGCFKCFSINGSDPGCADPFMPVPEVHYKTLCRQTRHHRVGGFPAKYCTKIKGVNLRTNTEMLVRTCDMESFDNTCGTFIFQGDEYHGCLMSCKTNACNSASPSLSLLFPLLPPFFPSSSLPPSSPPTSSSSSDDALERSMFQGMGAKFYVPRYGRSTVFQGMGTKFYVPRYGRQFQGVGTKFYVPRVWALSSVFQDCGRGEAQPQQITPAAQKRQDRCT
ncbi:uncharacterized protein LOC143299603 [Babylonia areolata]|uniref:uncharacterized protein LOC143299603 n=1 Tax=Babylonia areolata TaxID=304850 RepID=UPI003FD53654